MMDFSDALQAIKDGKHLKRAGWNGKDQYVYWFKAEFVVEFEPFLVIKNQQDKHVPWLASQGDLLAEDWKVL